MPAAAEMPAVVAAAMFAAASVLDAVAAVAAACLLQELLLAVQTEWRMWRRLVTGSEAGWLAPVGSLEQEV